MLFKTRFWPGLVDGSITLTFRRWRKLQAKAGGHYRTPAGMLVVERVDSIAVAKISAGEARRAGYERREDLLRDLGDPAGGEVYRIQFRFGGADPRDALARRGDVSGDEGAQLSTRLARLDAASRRAPWTTRVLRLIAERPGVRAGDLAAPG